MEIKNERVVLNNILHRKRQSKFLPHSTVLLLVAQHGFDGLPRKTSINIYICVLLAPSTTPVWGKTDTYQATMHIEISRLLTDEGKVVSPLLVGLLGVCGG